MQNLNQRTVNSLIKGLITEAGELTFPENASVDELNCSLYRDGSRSKRLGLELENGFALSSFNINEDEVLSVGRWDNPGGVAGLSFMIVQAGSTLYFYNSGVVPYSQQETGLSVNLSTYQITGKDITKTKVEFAVIASVLVVACEAIDTVYITYDGANLATSKVEFRVRDFDWLSDVCDLSEKIPLADVTAARRYDTLNTGWTGNQGEDPVTTPTLPGFFPGTSTPMPDVDRWQNFLARSGTGRTALDTYVSSRNAWPPLTHPWYSGKNSGGDFSLSNWEKIYSGSSLIGNGRFVVDFFVKDREAVSGVSGLPVETEPNRFTSVASYAGRIFYGGLSAGKNAGKILYSRLIETVDESDSCTVIGECFQQNDPTSEYFSDLLETDGGVIHIPEAYGIKKLYTHNQYLYVFAENGIWVIGGPDNRFSATNYYVSKVSNVGIFSAGSFVDAEGVPFWWSKYGIHTFAYDESSGFPMEQNLSINTIQSFWDKIDNNAKNNVTAAYDRINKQIFWLYPENDETNFIKKTRVLILDIPLQAFYPWKISANDNYPVGLFFYDGYGSNTFDDIVVDSTNADVITSTGGGVYTVGYSLLSSASTQLGVLTYRNSKMTISLFSSKTFLDWGTEPYDCFVECGYDFAGDLLLKKTAPYVTVYCRSTEEGFTAGPNFRAINPSSLFLEAYWDFKDYPSSRQQVYLVKPTPVVNPSNLSDNGQNKSVVTSRLKVRGKGRSMRLKFVAEEGKNFILLGYSVLVGVNARF